MCAGVLKPDRAPPYSWEGGPAAGPDEHRCPGFPFVLGQRLRGVHPDARVPPAGRRAGIGGQVRSPESGCWWFAADVEDHLRRGRAASSAVHWGNIACICSTRQEDDRPDKVTKLRHQFFGTPTVAPADAAPPAGSWRPSSRLVAGDPGLAARESRSRRGLSRRAAISSALTTFPVRPNAPGRAGWRRGDRRHEAGASFRIERPEDKKYLHCTVLPDHSGSAQAIDGFVDVCAAGGHRVAVAMSSPRPFTRHECAELTITAAAWSRTDTHRRVRRWPSVASADVAPW